MLASFILLPLVIFIEFVSVSSSSLPLHLLHLFSIELLDNKTMIEYLCIEYDVISIRKYQY